MISFHSVLPELAQRETRCIRVGPSPDATPGNSLPADEYAFVEFYCEDLNCDCRRVFIQVIGRNRPDTVLASINYGWEPASFYRERMPSDPNAPREIVEGSLDPMNAQSKHSMELLELFQQHVLDEAYRLRLKRHYELFREELRRLLDRAAAPGSQSGGRGQTAASDPADQSRIPVSHRERFKEVAAMLREFGRAHMDEELTGFAVELWKRICQRKKDDCLRGKATIWAASVTHVIARINFLFDKSQPVHLTFDTICDFFQTNKTTVGSKATEIERQLRLRQHCEPGLCRRDILETFTEVRLGDGRVVPFKMAKEMGYLPPDARIEDLL